jgi:hypothetical protein
LIGGVLTQQRLALSRIAQRVTRRIATRAVLVLFALVLARQVLHGLPQDQTLIFPVGSAFPHATRFAAAWKQVGDREAQGGVTLSFNGAPPLQIRQHAKLCDGDYIVTMDIVEGTADTEMARAHGGLQTTIERRVNLLAGETLIVLTPSSPAERL